jgi:hypothetical protein
VAPTTSGRREEQVAPGGARIDAVPFRDPEPAPDPTAADGTAVNGTATPYWWEDPDLAAAVAEVEEFAAAAGWDQVPQMFALVRTADLLSAQPGLAPTLVDAGVFTPIAQDVLPAGDLSEALSTIAWPDEVTGCVLVQEIVVLPPAAVQPDATVPGATARESNDVEITAEQAAAHPDRAEARLAAGVLRGSVGGACLLRVRGDNDGTPLRGADLAPNLLSALQATFLD